jgi:CheY-like chemotaxis protein
VANDNEFLLMANTTVLEKCNIEVVGAVNGLDAFEQATSTNQKFNIIILDLSMPIMDGYDAARKIISHFNNENRLFPDIEQPGM